MVFNKNIKVSKYFGYSYKFMFNPLISRLISVTEIFGFRLQINKLNVILLN